MSHPDARRCSIVPPYLLEAIARADLEHVSGCAAHTLDRDRTVRERRQLPEHPVTREQVAAIEPTGEPEGGPSRTIGDAQGTEQLPGQTVRREGEVATGDAAVD